jgi:hypothetical protein
MQSAFIHKNNAYQVTNNSNAVQGCQMQNIPICAIWRVPQWKMWVYFEVISDDFSSLGMLWYVPKKIWQP